MCLRVVVEFHREQPDPMIGMLVRTRTGMDVFGTNTAIEKVAIGPCRPGDVVEVVFTFDCWLTPQEYTLTAAVQHPDGHSHDWLDDVVAFRVDGPLGTAGVVKLHTRVECRLVSREKRSAIT